MEEQKKRGRGRPPLTEEEKKERALKKEQGIPIQQPWDQRMVSPGDNAKFLAHALAIREMPDIDVTDVKQVERRITEYFALCAQNDIKPTVKGFLNALRVSKVTLWNWKTGVFRKGTHQAVILEAYDMLEALWEDYMMNGKINPVSGIFLGKNNFGYQDKQEYVLTPNKMGEAVPVELIEAKYEELPEG